MKLIEFLGNIKRIGTNITIVMSGECDYMGTISSYINWIHRKRYDEREIKQIICGDSKSFIIEVIEK